MGLLQRLLPRRVLPGLLSETDGFVDLDLPLTRVSATAASPIYECRGAIDRTVVGFAVSLGSSWSRQQLEGTDATVHWGTGELRSLGSHSDQLIGLLAVKYGNNSYAERSMLAHVSAQVVCLGGDPSALPRENLKMKFFLNAEDDERRYAEVFVNLDFEAAVAQLHEKDPEYRLALLRSLTEA